MFDTNLVVVGNVLAVPVCRRVPGSGSLVANFRIASTSRRYDRENGRWIDGNNLRVRVTAWRRLAEGVGSSVKVGDPVIVYGRLYTRDWQDEQGNNRISYEMEAFSIGHDLARGRGKFYRTKFAPETDAVEADEGDGLVPVETEEIPRYGDGLPESLPGEQAPTFEEVTLGFDTGEEEPAETEEPATSTPRRSRRTKREPVAA